MKILKKQKMRSRYEGLNKNGYPSIDHGSAAKILVINGKKQLQWLYSHKSWGGIAVGCVHEPAVLEVVDYSSSRVGIETMIHSGGRLSPKLLNCLIPDINALMGTRFKLGDLHPNKTVIWEE